MEASQGMRRSMLLVGALAGACLVGAAAMVVSGRAGNGVVLVGSFTDNLDMVRVLIRDQPLQS